MSNGAAAIADLIAKEKGLDNIKRLVVASILLATLSMLGFLYVAIFHEEMIEEIAGLRELDAGSLTLVEFRSYW